MLFIEKDINLQGTREEQVSVKILKTLATWPGGRGSTEDRSFRLTAFVAATFVFVIPFLNFLYFWAHREVFVSAEVTTICCSGTSPLKDSIHKFPSFARNN